MEEEKEMKNSSPQKEMAARNGHFMASSLAVPSQLHSSINGHSNITTTNSSLVEDKKGNKNGVKYKECMKNHAASIGGNATDGCGEFMPGGEEGSVEALKCLACSCHRNFHRKEINGASDESLHEHHHHLHHSPPFFSNNGVLLGHAYPINSLASSLPPQVQPHQMILSYKSGSVPSESDEKDDEHGMRMRQVDHQKMKKRFRTKFSEEQKEKMLVFAEKAGWKMQKLEESMVQRFCQELGIKRKVLKVWMHNNKHNFAKKNASINS